MNLLINSEKRLDHDIVFNKRTLIVNKSMMFLIEQVNIFSLCYEEAECHSVSMKITSSALMRTFSDLS